MTVPTSARPEPVNANDAVEADKRSNSSNDDKYLVKTPWSTSVFRGEGFPDITPEGTECSEDERNAAKAAARVLGLKLSTSKIGG